VYAPACFDQLEWEAYVHGNLRRGVRSLGPVFETSVAQALWKSANYDFLNHDPVCPDQQPEHSLRRNILRWADGATCNWQLVNFSAPGPIMSVLVEKL
jgi:hypothetical protein